MEDENDIASKAALGVKEGEIGANLLPTASVGARSNVCFAIKNRMVR